MPPSPPPVAQTGKKKLATLPPAAVDLNNAATNTDSLSSDKTFVQKIQALLDVPNYSSIISWNDAGNVVIIHDVDAFISTIIPAHFKKSKFGSFIRRMRRWGFSVFTRKRSSSTARGLMTVVEFSSENFLRDQPDLCLLMKDERQVKKNKFTFLDRNVRKVGGGVESSNQGSSMGVCVPYPPSSLNMNDAKNRPESRQLEVPSVNVDLNVAMNDGYPHNYSQENSMSSMISPNVHSNQYSTMPMMNTMMSPHPPQLPYPPYGYGYGVPPHVYQYPAQYGYLPYPQQQHHHQQQQQIMQQNQQQEQQEQQQKQQQQQQQLEMMHQNQQYPPHIDPVNLTAVMGKKEAAATDAAASTTPIGNADAKASTASASAALLSSSSEETTELDLLSSTMLHPIVRNHPQFDTDQNEV
jgi:hypothetical protein